MGKFISLFYILFKMNIKLNLQPQNIFLFLGLVYGITFLLVLPPLQVPDGYAHFYKAYGISDGQLMPEKMGNNAGVYIPVDLLNTSGTIQEKMKLVVKEKHKLDMPFLFKESSIDNGNKVFVDFSKIAVVLRIYSYYPNYQNNFKIKYNDFCLKDIF